MSQKNFVELRNVSKRFGSNTVIDNITLTIPRGQMVTLLGPSGCGKTTILRLVAGLEKPSDGQIFIDGEDVAHRSIQQRDICMVFQSYALFPHMSLGENVGYGLKMLGIPRAEVKARVQEALAMEDLAGFDDRYVDQISGGQQQRVALARALILKPKVLLFDEPLSNLDANLRRSMREKIRELQKQFDITSLYVTHDQSEALSFADQVAVMRNGRLAQAGAPQDLYLRPVDEPTASFLGETLVLTAELAHGWADCALGRIAVDDRQRSGSARIMLRPEQIQIGLSDPAQRGQAVITGIDFAGFVSTLNLQMAADGAQLEIKTVSREGLRPGAQVSLNVMGQAHIFTG